MASSFKSISERLKQRARDRQSHAAWCYLPRLLLALLTLALLGAATWVVTWPGDGMTWVLSEGRILTVDPDGPGERAGLRPGDVVLAVVEARKQLPASVLPDKFPLLGGGPTKSSAQADDVVRITQAEIERETVVVTFMYRWNEPPLGSHDGDCPADRCHWWRFEACPSGVVLVEEGGAVPLSEEMTQ